MLKFCMKHQKKTLVLAGIIGSLGFPPLYAMPLFIFAMVLAWLMCDKAETYQKAALVGYFFGVGFFMSGFYWISNALLVDIDAFGFLYPIALLAPGLFFGLFMIPPFLFWHFLKNEKTLYKVLGFSSIFVVMEYIRSFLLTGFPWNMLGSMFGFSDMLVQTASVIGTYGLSFLMLVLTGACYALIKKEYKFAGIVLFLILFGMSIFGLIRLKTNQNNQSSLEVRLVQPSISQKMKWNKEALENNLKTYVDMSRRDKSENIKLVVWGETASAFNPEDSIYYRNIIRQAVPKNGYLITGLVRYDKQQEELFNSLFVIDKNGKTVAFYDKKHLVPFGEYIPFRKYLPKWVKPVANQIEDFSQGEAYKILEAKGVPNFGALICYEIIFPDAVINRKNKPNFLVVVSNDGWYGDSFGPHQHLVAARLRAVEEGITIIRSANNGISAVINPMGVILGKIPLNAADTKDIYLPEKLIVSTIYGYTGGITIQLGMLLLAVFLVIKKKLTQRV